MTLISLRLIRNWYACVVDVWVWLNVTYTPTHNAWFRNSPEFRIIISAEILPRLDSVCPKVRRTDADSRTGRRSICRFPTRGDENLVKVVSALNADSTAPACLRGNLGGGISPVVDVLWRCIAYQMSHIFLLSSINQVPRYNSLISISASDAKFYHVFFLVTSSTKHSGRGKHAVGSSCPGEPEH